MENGKKKLGRKPKAWRSEVIRVPSPIAPKVRKQVATFKAKHK